MGQDKGVFDNFDDTFVLQKQQDKDTYELTVTMTAKSLSKLKSNRFSESKGRGKYISPT